MINKNATSGASRKLNTNHRWSQAEEEIVAKIIEKIFAEKNKRNKQKKEKEKEKK